jgi:hypothetical protein
MYRLDQRSTSDQMKRFLNCLLIALGLAAGFSTTAAALRLPWHRKTVKPEVEVAAAKGKTVPAPRIKPERKVSAASDDGDVISKPGPIPFGPPIELSMTRAESSRIDLRALPQTPQALMERPEREAPSIKRGTIRASVVPPAQSRPSVPERNAPAPPTIMNFDGLDFANWGAGHPPDTNGDVGPTYYIQTVNTSVGIFRKSDGVRVAAFSFNTFMSQGHFGNLCDTDNFGDPVVLYDSFEDRWIITDFAFKLSGSNVINPPGNFQCFAASMSGDPVSGGWNFYSINTAGGLGDYPKFGIWPDGLYMSVNMFDYAGNGDFQNPRVYALNKAQMYAGKPSVQVLTFNAPSADFTILPSNARLQAGTPPPGSPNYFVSTEEFLNALTVYKFHVDWTHTAASTFTGPDIPFAATSWPNDGVPDAPSQGGSSLDVLEIRAMVQNQYTNLGGAESLWVPHTVRRPGIDGSGNPNGFAAPRWYQVDVTGGTVNDSLPQAATWDPDGANVIHRFNPSVAVDRAGDMALGYSTSSSTTKPALKYAGRLAADPINTLSQTEQVLFQGAGTQTTINRWGDYSAMTLDPDGCTFWYTNEYYAANGSNWQTRIGSFAFPSCTVVGAGGTISGTVTAAVGGAPISGATVTLGSRTATTNGSGVYSFLSLPAGIYSSITVADPGYNSASANSIAVTDGNTTTQNFALTAAPANACPADTTQSDFQTGVPTNVDVANSPGDVILLNPVTLDQQNTTIGDAGGNVFGGVITSTTFGGQTFTAAISGTLHAADINLFCNGCTGTTPNLTVSVRATSGGLPTGADLASATIPGFSDDVAAYYTATFASPATLTAGTMYALVVRPVSNPSVGTYALSRSGASGAGDNIYAGGTRVSDSANGTSWSIPLTGGVSTDAGFKTYMQTGFVASGDLISSARDSNPASGLTPFWQALSWTATTPAQTSLKFQAAGSNSADGPFNFIGPDGTSATFFTTSGASLSQFNSLRYVKYRAYLATTNAAVTPTLSDVTICYAVADCSSPAAITSSAQACPNSTGNTASGPAGATSYSWSITNGTITGDVSSQTVTYTAGASGNVGLTLNIVEAVGCHKSGSVNVSIPPAASITPGGPTTFCAGGSVTLTSSRPVGNQWYLNGNPIGGATSQAYVANASGNYTVTGDGCTSNASPIVAVTVNPIPATPTITPGGPTTFCTGGGVTLTSSSASGNQWFLNGNPIAGATNQVYTASASGNYTVTVTTSGCSSAPSAITTITVNSTPFTPTITAGGPTTFCTGGSVILRSGSTAGNQWYLNNNPIAGATNATYVASASGDYTIIVTTTGCTSNTSAPTTVTVNPNPATPTITPGGPTTFCAGGSVTLTSSSASGNQWFLNGNPIGGATNTTFLAAAAGSYTVTVTGSGCTSASAATNVTVPPVTVASILPVNGSAAGGTPATINGTCFVTGAGVTIGGTAATNVVVVSATQITAKTPAHAAATVNVTVTNPDNSTGTLTNGYVFLAHQFDPNGDSLIDLADIFYLINHFFAGGPPPQGAAGTLSGDANGDGSADMSDLFYVINYIFTQGPAPFSAPVPGRITTTAFGSNAAISGDVTLGTAVLRDGRYVIPVIVTTAPGSDAAQVLSLSIHFSGGDQPLTNASIHRATNVQPVFETSKQSGDALAYLVFYNGFDLGRDGHPAVVAEIDIGTGNAAGVRISVEPGLTMLSNQAGTRSATVGNGLLHVSGTTIDRASPAKSHPHATN